MARLVTGAHRAAQRRRIPVSLRRSAGITWCAAMVVGSIGCVFHVGALVVPVSLVAFALTSLVPDWSWRR
jgi:hypothetical protein